METFVYNEPSRYRGENGCTNCAAKLQRRGEVKGKLQQAQDKIEAPIRNQATAVTITCGILKEASMLEMHTSASRIVDTGEMETTINVFLDPQFVRCDGAAAEADATITAS